MSRDRQLIYSADKRNWSLDLYQDGTLYLVAIFKDGTERTLFIPISDWKFKAKDYPKYVREMVASAILYYRSVGS